MKVDILNLLVDDIVYSRAVNTYTLYFDDIVESISSNGLLMKPIVIKEGAITYRLEDGHLRIEALKKLGIPDVVAIVLIPEENEKKEDIKKKIDDILLTDYDNVKLNKVFPPYYVDQQKLLLNMIDSFDKIQKDLTHINEQIAKNDTNLLLNNDKKLPLTDINNINNMVNNLKNEISNLNTFILQEISYVNVRYNTENLAIKGTELNNLVFNKIKFSNTYLNQTLVSSNQIVNFVDNKKNITNILSKNSPLYEYISKISSNIYQTNYTLLSPKPAYKPLKSLLNALKIDNKLFKLRNINSLIKKHIFPARENNVTNIKLRQDVGNNVKPNKILNLFNFEHKRNDSIFSKQKIHDVTRFIKRIFNPTPRKPEGIHVRPSILNEINIPTRTINPINSAITRTLQTNIQRN